jgi:urease accessory protein
MQLRSLRLSLLIALVAALSPGSAWAHVGVASASGFSHGLLHPIGGLDHVLAMVAVGMFAANLGGRALWAVPATFVTIMAFGGFLGIQHVGLPYAEIGIALSVVILGLVVTTQVHWPIAAAMALAGVFAVFHGHAHGAEMPLGASGASYAAGFIIATALLHAAGIAIGLQSIDTLYRHRAAQVGGGAMILVGIALLAGIV